MDFKRLKPEGFCPYSIHILNEDDHLIIFNAINEKYNTAIAHNHNVEKLREILNNLYKISTHP